MLLHFERLSPPRCRSCHIHPEVCSGKAYTRSDCPKQIRSEYKDTYMDACNFGNRNVRQGIRLCEYNRQLMSAKNTIVLRQFLQSTGNFSASRHETGSGDPEKDRGASGLSVLRKGTSLRLGPIVGWLDVSSILCPTPSERQHLAHPLKSSSSTHSQASRNSRGITHVFCSSGHSRQPGASKSSGRASITIQYSKCTRSTSFVSTAPYMRPPPASVRNCTPSETKTTTTS